MKFHQFRAVLVPREIPIFLVLVSSLIFICFAAFIDELERIEKSVSAQHALIEPGLIEPASHATFSPAHSMPSPQTLTDSEASTRFAIIGDYGWETKDTLAVSNLVKGWNPEFITTVGDNNYPDGSMRLFDDNVGRFYHQYIQNYIGRFGEGSPHQRFYPALGNHDWESIYCTASSCHGPYFDYFGIDSANRYYTFQKGPVRFFMMDSDSKEPDGISGISRQALWLKEQLAASDTTWNLVYLHHPPYSSGGDRSHERLQWPFAEWGADAILSGHNHVYERIERDDTVFFVNGVGGKSQHQFTKEKPAWVKSRFNGNFGAMLVEATTESITFQFYDRFEVLHDSFTLTAHEDYDAELQSASNRRRVSARIAHAAHDATQDLKTGLVQSIDYVLSLGEAGGNEPTSLKEPTMVGLRFVDVQIPPDAVIVDAHIEFTNQRDENSNVSFVISGERACHAQPFTGLAHSLTARPKTTNSLHWTELDDWELIGESHNTENLAPIVQEIVDYNGWQQGNAMAFYLHGSGQRNTVPYELQPAMAAQLHVTYDLPSPPVGESGNSDTAASTSGGSATILPNGIYLPMLINHGCVLD